MPSMSPLYDLESETADMILLSISAKLSPEQTILDRRTWKIEEILSKDGRPLSRPILRITDLTPSTHFQYERCKCFLLIKREKQRSLFEPPRLNILMQQCQTITWTSALIRTTSCLICDASSRSLLSDSLVVPPDEEEEGCRVGTTSWLVAATEIFSFRRERASDSFLAVSSLQHTGTQHHDLRKYCTPKICRSHCKWKKQVSVCKYETQQDLTVTHIWSYCLIFCVLHFHLVQAAQKHRAAQQY